MNVPLDSQFSDANFLRHLNVKTQVLSQKVMKELDKDPRYLIRPKDPGQRLPMLEPVVVAGVAFYLDHENQLAVPMKPVALPKDSGSKTGSRMQQQSKVTSQTVSPMQLSMDSAKSPTRKVKWSEMDD